MFKSISLILFCFNFFVTAVIAVPSEHQKLLSKEIQNTYMTSQSVKIPRSCLVLITGCGRSGTTYTTNLLRTCGLDIKHEDIGIDGSVSWLMAVDSDYTPHGPGSNGTYFRHTFHQIRNPLDVITSFYININNDFLPAWNYIIAYVPEIKREDPSLVKCAKYWYYWNLKAEQKAEWRYRIEDIEEVLEEMSIRLGVVINKNVLNVVPKNTNSWHPIEKKITWKELQQVLSEEDFNNIQQLAIKYGYSVID